MTSDCYLTISCILHNIQIYLCNAVTYAKREGGFDDKQHQIVNYLQMLHGVYTIQNCKEHEYFKELRTLFRDDVANEEFRKLEDLIMTR